MIFVQKFEHVFINMYFLCKFPFFCPEWGGGGACEGEGQGVKGRWEQVKGCVNGVGESVDG